MIRQLTIDECRHAMESGDFDEALVSGPAAAIILTQSWCPQWVAMKAYFATFPEVEGLKVYYVDYDLMTLEAGGHKDFMTYKETRYKNDKIPFVLYYKDGALVGESNYVSLDDFKKRFA
jgi:hypothetical protein